MFIKSIKKYIQDSIFEFESISSNEGEYSRLRLLFFLLIRRPVQIFKTVKVRAIIKKRDEVFYSVNKYDKSGVDVYPETLEEFSRRFEKCMPNSLRKVGYQNMVYASNCLDNIEFSRSLKEYVDFLYDAFPYLPDMVENAYFIHDIPNNKAPAHSLHRDGLGVRFKVWLVLNAEGVIGIEYIQADAKTLDDSRYGLYSSIYPKPSKVNKKASFLQAERGLLYCLDTNCLHKGRVERGSARLALVVEFIDRIKMLSIDGIFDPFHYDQKLDLFFQK